MHVHECHVYHVCLVYAYIPYNLISRYANSYKHSCSGMCNTYVVVAGQYRLAA
jgi:hypothetical protein